MSGKGSLSRTKSGQFRKGQSGNPKGRPKGQKHKDSRSSAYDVIVDKTLSVSKDGVSREVTVEEALQHKTYQQALSGNRAARREILRMILNREQALARRAPKQSRDVKLLEGYNPENANDAVMLLGIGRRYDIGPEYKYDRWKLEPWAVQAALSRRRGAAKLTDNEIAEIKRTTWEADTLVWPRGSST